MNSVGGAPGGVFTTVPIPGLPTTLAPLSGNMSQPRSMGDANVSGDCIDILRQPRPVTATFKIADLGLEPALSAALAQPLHLFVSGDGQKFEAVSVPADLVNNPNQNPFSAGAQVLADRHGFVLLNKTSDSAGEHIALYRSGDGRAWTKIGAVEGSVISVGTVGGRTSMWLWNTAEQTGSRAVRLSDDGNTIEDNVGNTRDNAAFQIGTDWSIHPGSDSVSIGDAGYTVVLSQDPGTAGTSPFHLGGFTFTISWINDGNILKVTDDATGEVVADGALPFENRGSSPTDPRIQVSGEQLTIVGADGKVRVTLPLAQIFQERVYAADNNVMKSAQLLDSPDGITWTSTKVADLIDLDAVPVIRISNVYVDRDRIILTLLVARHDSGPADTITFVGRRG